MTSSGHIQAERQGDVCIIRFNDPGTRNALGGAMATEIRDALLAAEGDCGAVVLAGDAKAFCSGANLAADRLTSGPTDVGRALQDMVNPLMMTIRDLSIPIISSVRGAAVGVGASIALSADMVVAAEDAFFLLAFSRMGLVPDGGVPWLVARTAGRVRAMEMMLLGERLPAATALEWGMVNRVVPNQHADATAIDLAARLAQGPRRALGMVRNAVWHACDSGFAEELALERRFQRAAGMSPDFAEGIRAFAEKRAPRFNRGASPTDE